MSALWADEELEYIVRKARNKGESLVEEEAEDLEIDITL